MSAMKPQAIVASTVYPGGSRGHARVEKVRHSNALDGERRNAQRDDTFTAAKSARIQLSRNETAIVEPDRDQRLVPAFVTQLLAQVMTGGQAQPALAASAYRHRAPQIALVYDRGI